MTPCLADALLLLALLVGPAMPTDGTSCRVEGDSLPAVDMAAIGVACEAARQRFTDLLGDPVPQVLVLVQDRAGYRIGILDGQAVVLWPRSLVDGYPAGGGADPRDMLRHEIAHALTAARFFPDGAFESTGYGTPLPDWFEEGVAIWAEPRTSRERRLAAARSLPAVRLDLRTILTMRHPAAGDAAALARRDGVVTGGSSALYDFYQQSLALLSFIHDTGGEAAVRELATRLLIRPDDPDVVAGLPGLPSEFAAVDAAWQAWLQ